MVTVFKSLELLLELPLVELIEQTFVKLTLRHKVLDHQSNSVHLLRLGHIKPDLQRSLKLLNSELEHFLLNKVFVYLDMVFLNVDLKLRNNVLELLNVV